MTPCETHRWVQISSSSYSEDANEDAWMGGHSTRIVNHHTTFTYECSVCGQRMVNDSWSDGLGNGGEDSYPPTP